jgi:NADPH:quinone reductase
MSHAIVIHETGGPEVLRWEPIELGPPGPGEARVRLTASGLNFIDTYERTGLYPRKLPAILGTEGAGVVEAVGPDVTDFAPGDRVAYAAGSKGSYAEALNQPASILVKLPANVDDRTAAAAMLKGLTAHYLVEIGRLRETPRTVLVQAAAGGVGLLLSQWAKHHGATVIGTAGSEEKADLARAHGCDHVILYRGLGPRELRERVRAITHGAGVDVVYDAVGKDTFDESLASLRPRGLMVTYGQSSGPISPFSPRVLAEQGSLFLTRPILRHYIADRAALTARTSELFAAIANGVLRVRIAQTYPLREAARAHRDLEDRKTTGSTLLLP